LRSIHRQHNLSKPNLISGCDLSLAFELDPVHEGAVHASEITQDKVALIDPQLGVASRDGGIGERHRVFRSPAYGVNAVFYLEA